MKESIASFINHCVVCGRIKQGKNYSKLEPRQQEKLPWNAIALDIAGPINMSEENDENIDFEENKFILTIVDMFSRWTELVALKDISAITVSKALDNQWLCRYPKPNVCVSDQGTQFLSNEFQELLLSYGIKSRPTTAYNPTGNSICERLNGAIISKVRTISNPVWSEELQAIAWTLRTRYQITLQCSPAQIIFGTLMLDSNQRF